LTAARSIAASLCLLAIRALTAAQEAPPEYFQETAKPHLAFQWDFLARYDNINHLQSYTYYYDEISRGRFELRPELDFLVSPTVKFGVRAVFDYGTEPNYDNALYGDNYVSRGAVVNEYYFQWTPGPWNFQAGAFEIPVVASEMMWDHRDVTTPGAALSYVHTFGPGSTLTFTGAGIYSAQRYRDKSLLGVGQVVWNWGDASRFAVQAASAFWNMDMDDVDPQYYRQNRIRIAPDGTLSYLSKFQLLDNLVTLRFPLGGIPMSISLDFVHNFGSVGTGPNAYEAAAMAGGVGTPGRWRAFFVYQHIGRDAVVGAYNTDDWWWHTWAEGYRAGFAYTVLPLVYFQPSVMWQRRLDSYHWVNRVTLDLVKMF
jgi:hypothetical protein